MRVFAVMPAETIDINAAYGLLPAGDNDSKKDMVYTTDSGKKKIVKISETMGELLGFEDYTVDTVLTDEPFVEITEERIVHASSVDGKIRQSFRVGNPTKDIFASGGFIVVARKGSVAGIILAVTGTTGEKKRIITAADTGQTSGDST